MKAIRFRVELLEPLLATSLQGDPNSARSYPFLPGSLFRGVVIAQYIRDKDIDDLDLADETVQRLFFNGQTRYLPAYLTIYDENSLSYKRTLPTPLGWYEDKGKDSDKEYEIYDKAHPDANDEHLINYFKQPKAVKSTFCLCEDDEVTLHSPDYWVMIHTQRNRQAGRATKSDGAVFRYEALAAGQVFEGIILCDQAQDVETIKSLLTEELWLGRAKRAGYGRVKICFIEEDDWFADEEWQETTTELDDIATGDQFSITLLSDIIARDENGNHTDILPVYTVSQALNNADVEQLTSWKQATLVGGFNQKWGLPIPQTIAIRAGSVFCFRSKADISTNQLNELLKRGLGERREDGFGRIAINWHGSEPILNCVESSKASLNIEDVTLSGETCNLAQRMVNRLAQRDEALQLGKSIYQTTIFNPPKRSQLGGLRVKLRTAMNSNNVDIVLDYLTEMKQQGRDQFDQARVQEGAQPVVKLSDWLRQKLSNPRSSILVSDDISIGGVTVSSQQLTRLTLRYIDGVLAKNMKEQASE